MARLFESSKENKAKGKKQGDKKSQQTQKQKVLSVVSWLQKRCDPAERQGLENIKIDLEEGVPLKPNQMSYVRKMYKQYIRNDGTPSQFGHYPPQDNDTDTDLRSKQQEPHADLQGSDIYKVQNQANARELDQNKTVVQKDEPKELHALENFCLFIDNAELALPYKAMPSSMSSLSSGSSADKQRHHHDDDGVYQIASKQNNMLQNYDSADTTTPADTQRNRERPFYQKEHETQHESLMERSERKEFAQKLLELQLRLNEAENQNSEIESAVQDNNSQRNEILSKLESIGVEMSQLYESSKKISDELLDLAKQRENLFDEIMQIRQEVNEMKSRLFFYQSHNSSSRSGNNNK